MGKGIIVVDMIHDFIDGKLGSEGAQAIREDMAAFLDEARAADIPIVYVHDAHIEEDPEMAVWGEHAMAGTKGSEIDPMVSPEPHDTVMPKHFYDAFNDTVLHNILRAKDVDEVAIVGVSTDICVQHTAWGAFRNHIPATVLSDLTAAIESDKHENALVYMQEIYGTRVQTSEEWLAKTLDRSVMSTS